jgi:hypothetical protein
MIYVLERAWVNVRRNGGAAGIDRTTIADVEQYRVSRLLDELAADLKDGRWRPLPARPPWRRSVGLGEVAAPVEAFGLIDAVGVGELVISVTCCLQRCLEFGQ